MHARNDKSVYAVSPSQPYSTKYVCSVKICSSVCYTIFARYCHRSVHSIWRKDMS